MKTAPPHNGSSVYLDEFKQQLPDIDPAETGEWMESLDQVVEEEGEEAPSARFALTRAQASAFVDRAQELMRGGRPICPMCSGAIDPDGHACPRSNGHVVPKS